MITLAVVHLQKAARKLDDFTSYDMNSRLMYFLTLMSLAKVGEERWAIGFDSKVYYWAKGWANKSLNDAFGGWSL